MNTPPSTNSIVLTGFANFYRADGSEGQRHYAKDKRDAAREYATDGDPVMVQGFGVYDTTVTTEYVTALYATADEAAAHEPAKPPAAPEAVIETAPRSPDMLDRLAAKRAGAKKLPTKRHSASDDAGD